MQAKATRPGASKPPAGPWPPVAARVAVGSDYAASERLLATASSYFGRLNTLLTNARICVRVVPIAHRPPRWQKARA